MLCNKPVPQWWVLQPVGLLRNKRTILRGLLPKWKLLGNFTHAPGFSAKPACDNNHIDCCDYNCFSSQPKL